MDGKCFISAVLLAAMVGCGQSSQPATNATATTQAKPTGTPSDAVATFLESLRAGNNDQAAAMLTPLARQKTLERNMVVAPPGLATSKFKLEGYEFINPEKNVAHVKCFWTDALDDRGNTRTDEILWAMRLETDGWRIGGMILKPFPDQPPLVMNFEDPDDMIRKQELIQAAEGDPSGTQPAQGAQPTSMQPQASRPDATAPAQR
jgi:hypothetical protein